MSKIRYIGLDVHKDTITIAVADMNLPANVLATIPNDTGELLKRLRKLSSGTQLKVCYEAGPTGFGLCRDLRAAKIDCIVVAPSLIPVRSGERIKTDRRDACKLAHFLRSGDLTSVWVPDIQTEAMRDLLRARDAAKRAERVARQQLDKFLLRQGRIYTGKTKWTRPHVEWIQAQKFELPAQQRVLSDAMHTIQEATGRVARLMADVTDLLPGSKLAPLVKELQAFRGVDVVTAATVAAEIGDFTRFSKASQFMAFVGLVPSEHSSGGTRRVGRITKTGNQHVRRLLVEAAWHYRHPPRIGRGLFARQQEVNETTKRIAWKAQHRLYRKSSRLLANGKSPNKVVTAIARELAGFLWDAARQPHLQPGDNAVKV